MMTRGGEGGKKCRKFDDVICERPLIQVHKKTHNYFNDSILLPKSEIQIKPKHRTNYTLVEIYNFHLLRSCVELRRYKHQHNCSSLQRNIGCFQYSTPIWSQLRSASTILCSHGNRHCQFGGTELRENVSILSFLQSLERNMRVAFITVLGHTFVTD